MSTSNEEVNESRPAHLDVALALFRMNYDVIPNCWPVDVGGETCGIPWHMHEPKHIGKVPIIDEWQKKGRLDEKGVRSLWGQYPSANVGLNLETAELLHLDPDSAEGLAESQRRGIPPTVFRTSRNPSYLYRRDGSCPITSTTHKGDSGAIDVMTKGQVIVYGQHRLGHPIDISSYDLTDSNVSPAPGWAVQILREAAERQPGTSAAAADLDEPPVRLNAQGSRVWHGEIVKNKNGEIVPFAEGVDVDRSETLFLIGQDLTQAGATRRTIIDALANRDKALGYEKYNIRRDEGAKEYARIADRVLAPRPAGNGRIITHGSDKVADTANESTIQPSPSATSGVDSISRVPALPDEACLSDALVDEAATVRATLLDPYIAMAGALSPRTPRALHEVCAVFALCLTIARRVSLQAGPKDIYPSLMFLFVGRSTLSGKTTALDVLRKVLTDTGLLDLLLPSSFTPQALMADLALNVPTTIRDGTSQAQTRWLDKHRHAAQRAIIRDEAAGLLEDCTKDYNAGLLPLLLKLDGAPDYVDSDLTISRGLVEIRDVCVNLLGTTTPAALREHASKPYHWHNGLFGRICLSAPDEEPHWAFWTRGETVSRTEVVTRLRRIYSALPTPTVTYEYGEPSKEDKARPVVGATQLGYQARRAQIDADAWDAWSRYDRALFSLAARDDSSERLDPTYGRLASAAIRVALALAVADWALLTDVRDAPIVIRVGHWAAAQQITERWRQSAHFILASALTEEEAETQANQSARLARLLVERGGRVGRGDILRSLNWTTTQLDTAIATSGGRITEDTQKTRGRPAEWIILTDVHVTTNSNGHDNSAFGAFSSLVVSSELRPLGGIFTSVGSFPTNPTKELKALKALNDPMQMSGTSDGEPDMTDDAYYAMVDADIAKYGSFRSDRPYAENEGVQ